MPGVQISIHALLTESDCVPPAKKRYRKISIHALLTESDALVTILPMSWYDFNPRSPHGERRFSFSLLISLVKWISIHALLTESDQNRPTLPLRHHDFNPRSPHGERRVTMNKKRALSLANFNPRSPHGERQRTPDAGTTSRYISIHALLTESDLFMS